MTPGDEIEKIQHGMQDIVNIHRFVPAVSGCVILNMQRRDDELRATMSDDEWAECERRIAESICNRGIPMIAQLIALRADVNRFCEG